MLTRVCVFAAMLAFVATVMPIASGPRPAFAQAQGGPIIIVIDTQRILRESEAVRSIQQQVGEQRTAYQNALKEKEKALREKDQELMRQSTILSAEVFSQKKRELEEQVGALQREIQEKRRALDKVFAEGMKEVQAALVDITRDIAQARQADLVLQRATVVYVRPEMEITEEALQKLNAALSTVSLPALQN